MLREIVIYWERIFGQMSCELVQKICEKNNFVLKDKLGSGSFGTTYKANSEYWGDFALKVYDKGSKKDAINEVKALAKLKISGKHINVAQLYDYEISDDYSFVASEFVEGKNLLEERLSQMGESARRERTFLPMDRKTLVFLFEKISSGLEFIHSAGIVHNDLKLENIMIDENMNPKIIDLGLAGMRGRSAVIYGAPEVILDNQKPTTRSDVYQLGILFYYLATGHPPFSTGNWREYVDEIVGEKQKQLQRNKRNGLGIEQIRELESKVGKSITKFIARMIDPDSSKRPKDAKAVHKFFSAKRGFIVNRKHITTGIALLSLFAGYKYGDNQGWFDKELEYITLRVRRFGNENQANPMQRDIHYSTQSSIRFEPLIETDKDEYCPKWLNDGFLFIRENDLIFRASNEEKKIVTLDFKYSLYDISPNMQKIAYTKEDGIFVAILDERRNLKEETKLEELRSIDQIDNPFVDRQLKFIDNEHLCIVVRGGLKVYNISRQNVGVFRKVNENNKSSKILVKDSNACYPVYVKNEVTGSEELFYTSVDLESSDFQYKLCRMNEEGNITVLTEEDNSGRNAMDFISTHFEPDEIVSTKKMPPFH